ncbi:MAG: hypothetical protein AB1831_13500 [Pseudomonadota bacterium]
MAEAIASLLSDPEGGVVRARYVVIYAPKRSRKRFPEGCVTEYESAAQALAGARPAEGYHAAVASGPSRSSEGFRLYYLVRWLD